MGASRIFPCGVCEEPLFLVPGCRPLLLHCDADHWCSIGALLRKGLPSERTQPERVLRTWDARVRVVQELVRLALGNGHALAAADLQDAAEQIARRVRDVRILNRVACEAAPATGDLRG